MWARNDLCVNVSRGTIRPVAALVCQGSSQAVLCTFHVQTVLKTRTLVHNWVLIWWINSHTESFVEYSEKENNSAIMETYIYLIIQNLIGCFCWLYHHFYSRKSSALSYSSRVSEFVDLNSLPFCIVFKVAEDVPPWRLWSRFQQKDHLRRAFFLPFDYLIQTCVKPFCIRTLPSITPSLF